VSFDDHEGVLRTHARSARRRPGGAWRAVAWIVTAIMAATVCCSVLRIPLQVTDSLVPMLDAQRSSSVIGAFASGATNAGYFRPLRAAQIQALFELSNGHYFAAYKGFQAAAVLVVFALFLAVLEVDSRQRVAALLFALTVLTGLHTFRGTVWEAYPVNHSLEVVAFCLLALLLARSKAARWTDTAAALTFIAATFTVESGLLVWVVIVAAWLTGARGISRRGVAIVTVLLAGYLAMRFAYLGTGVPALSERSSGFGLRQLDPGELQRRFGAWPYGFYAYNVLSSILTVLFSEPRAGIWTIPAEFMRGRIAGGTLINVVSSAVTTALVGWFVATRWRAWWTRTFDRDDQIAIVSLAVIAANALISYGYTKDEIMGPGGVFYALAACVAVAALLRSAVDVRRVRPSTGALRGGPAMSALAIVLAIASFGWVVRTAGLHYQMNLMTFYDRNEWVYVDDWLVRQNSAPATDAGKALVRQLREDALERAAVNPYLLSPRLDQWFR
jgi:hypothetical protein